MWRCFIDVVWSPELMHDVTIIFHLHNHNHEWRRLTALYLEQVPDRVGVLIDYSKEEILFFHEGHPVGRIISSHVRGRSRNLLSLSHSLTLAPCSLSRFVRSICAPRFGAPGIISAQKLTNLYRKVGMSILGESVEKEEIHLVPRPRQVRTVTQVNRGSIFALKRSTLDLCLGGQRSLRAAQPAKRTVLASLELTHRLFSR